MINRNSINLLISVSVKIEGEIISIPVNSEDDLIKFSKTKSENFNLILNITNDSDYVIHPHELLITSKNNSLVFFETKLNKEEIRKKKELSMEINVKCPNEEGNYNFKIFIMHTKRKLNYFTPQFNLEIKN